MKQCLSLLLATTLTATLVGCGGGATSDPAPPSIQSGGLTYGKQATFYVGITSVNPGTTFSATHCSTLQSTPSNVASYLAYTCTINAAGALVFTGTDDDPGTLATLMPPPMSASSRLQMASPSPVPPNCRVVLPSACEKIGRASCRERVSSPV